MEPLDDAHYLNPPDILWCPAHDYPRPCPECRAEAEEWRGEWKRETR